MLTLPPLPHPPDKMAPILCQHANGFLQVSTHPDDLGPISPTSFLWYFKFEMEIRFALNQNCNQARTAKSDLRGICKNYYQLNDQ